MKNPQGLDPRPFESLGPAAMEQIQILNHAIRTLGGAGRALDGDIIDIVNSLQDLGIVIQSRFANPGPAYPRRDQAETIAGDWTFTGALVGDLTGEVTGGLTGDTRGTHTGPVTLESLDLLNAASGSTVTINGTFNYRPPEKLVVTTPYTVLNTDRLIRVVPPSADIELDLLALASAYPILVVNDGSTYDVILDPNGVDTIQDLSTTTWTLAPGESINLTPGTRWYIG